MSDHSQHETCEQCGAELHISDWPWCPHGPYRGDVIQDTLPGGAQWIENLDTTPVWVESKSQLRREAEQRGLRWDPKPTRRTPPNPEVDQRGRFNGGAYPTYRT